MHKIAPTFTKKSVFPKPNILGEYKFRIFKEKEEDGDWFLAEITCPDGYKGMTQGENEEDILDMVADWIMCVYEIRQNKWYKQPLWWWNRLRWLLGL